MADTDVSTPLKLQSGESLNVQRRLVSGDYSAIEIGGIVTVRATNIKMSGLHAYAALVYIPTFAPPIRFALYAYETAPQTLNLIIGSAETHFTASEGISKVEIQDSNGVQTVEIQHL